MIAKGLATAFTVPPNTRFLDCYTQVENTSRLSNKGIWAHDNYKLKKATSIKPNTRGFRLIEGRVMDVTVTKKNTWLNLRSYISIQIRNKDRQYFDEKYLLCLKDKLIEIRGWLRPRKIGSYISLRHPAALKLVDEDKC